jgi:3-hydroxyisobutyrate dehydrogenase
MMLKDLKLAQQAAQGAGAPTPLGAAAASLYGLLVQAGLGPSDFSVMAEFIKGRTNPNSVSKN